MRQNRYTSSLDKVAGRKPGERKNCSAGRIENKTKTLARDYAAETQENSVVLRGRPTIQETKNNFVIRSFVSFLPFLSHHKPSTKSERFCPARPNVWGLTLRVAGFRSRVDIALFLFSPTWPVIPLGGGKSGRVAYLRNSKSQNWTMRENIILRLRGSRF